MSHVIIYRERRPRRYRWQTHVLLSLVTIGLWPIWRCWNAVRFWWRDITNVG